MINMKDLIKQQGDIIRKDTGMNIKEKLSPAQAKKAHKKFKETGEVPPHLKKLLKKIKEFEKKNPELSFEVEDIVVPGLEWMSKIKEEQLKEVGAAPLYKKHIKSIDKYRDQVGREVLKFYDLLRKKGLDDAADTLLDNYKNSIIKFGKDLKQLVRKIM